MVPNRARHNWEPATHFPDYNGPRPELSRRSMTIRRHFIEPSSQLDYEIQQEKAVTLGRLGRALEAALADLAEYDASAADCGTQDGVRQHRVRCAGMALWHLIVQRESLGLRDSTQVLRDYRVPREVFTSMGAFPAQRDRK